MPDTIRILGQNLPAANTLITFYTVPSATSTVISTLKACNQAPVNSLIRISVALGNAADTPAQYLYYDFPLGPGDTLSVTEGLSLAVTDVIRVYSSTGLVSFHAFGVEIT